MANDNTNAINTVPGSWVDDDVTRDLGVYTADHGDEPTADTVAHNGYRPDDSSQHHVDQEDLRRDSMAQDDVDLQPNGQDQEASSEILPTKPTVSVLESRPDLPYWNPIWLQKLVLAAFGLVSFSSLLAVVILYLVSNSRHGLSHQNSNNHYTWRYGPTASKSTCDNSTPNADPCSNHCSCYFLVPARSLV
jgi:hypothetical protein